MQQVDTVEVLKSLADSARLSIVRKLRSDGCETAGNKIVQNCAEVMKLSQPTMSHHFAKLVQSGVLRERKVGIEKYYELNLDILESSGINIDKL